MRRDDMKKYFFDDTEDILYQRLVMYQAKQSNNI